VLAACALAGGAQREGTAWTGILRDGRGNAIAGATVNAQSGAIRGTATTGKDGRFAIHGLPAGEYSIGAKYQDATATWPRTVRLPGDGAEAVLEWQNLDVALIKDTPLGKRAGGELTSIQFRAEFFQCFQPGELRAAFEHGPGARLRRNQPHGEFLPADSVLPQADLLRRWSIACNSLALGNV